MGKGEQSSPLFCSINKEQYMTTGKLYLDHQRSPCPCGSKRLIKNCTCLRGNGQLIPQPAEIAVKSHSKNFSQAGCYAASTAQCSKGLSKEHYISHSLLKIIVKEDGSIGIKGLPWSKNESVRLFPANLWSKILCVDHNQAMKGLDSVAARFFRQLYSIPEQLNVTGPDSILLVNGADLELWFLKLLCGLCTVNQKDQPHWEIPANWLALLFRKENFDYAAGQGLYCSAWIDRQDNAGKYFDFTIYHKESDYSVAGIQANMGGVFFFLCLQKMLKQDVTLFHPDILAFKSWKSARNIYLALGWERFPSGKAINILQCHPDR